MSRKFRGYDDDDYEDYDFDRRKNTNRRQAKRMKTALKTRNIDELSDFEYPY